MLRWLCVLTAFFVCGNLAAQTMSVVKRLDKALLVKEIDVENKDSRRWVPVPSAIRNKQLSVIGCFYESMVKNDDDLSNANPIRRFVGNTYALKMKKGVTVFAVRLNEIQPVFDGGFLLAAYDGRKKTFSQTLLFVSTKNMDPSMRGLGLEFRKVVRLDSRGEVVTAEVGHDGNVYSAVIKNFFSIGDDLSFQRRLTLEEQSIDPKSGVMIVRKVEGSREGIVTVGVRAFDVGSKSAKYAVGRVYLKPDEQGKLVVAKKELLDKTFDENNLFNGFGEDAKFLREGYGYFKFPPGCAITR
jgi:hypothetical protein